MYKILFFILFSVGILHAEDEVQVVKIMPLGDSITYGDHYDDERPAGERKAYRSHLWYMLENTEMNVNFVGSQVAGQDVTPPFDPDNEGHPGWKSTEIAEKTYMYMTQSDPDVVLLHIGTNDRGSTSPAGVNDILNQIDLYEYYSNHPIKVFVALIIDRKEHDGEIAIFNSRLKDLLEQRIATGDDIVIVDMYHNAGLTSNDYIDPTHPSDYGYSKMARVWFNALMANPYDPNRMIQVPLELYPETIVPKENILSSEIDGLTIKFRVLVPEDGIEIK